MSKIDEKLAEYCLHGGLYDSELMRHDKVRELLFDCRDEIARLRLTDAERAALRLGQRLLRESYAERPNSDFVAAAAVIDGLLARLGGGE